MSQTFTTRAEAAAPPAELVEIMAIAAWDSERSGTSLPGLAEIEPRHAGKLRKAMSDGIQAAESSGYRLVRS